VRSSERECRRSHVRPGHRSHGGDRKSPRAPAASPRRARLPSCRPSPPAIPGIRPSLFRRQISNAFAIDIVGAKYARIDAVGEALIGLFDRCHDAECKIQRLHTPRIEARALHCRAIAGCGFESPAWVMRAIAGSGDLKQSPRGPCDRDSHARPPPCRPLPELRPFDRQRRGEAGRDTKPLPAPCRPPNRRPG